MCQRLLLFISIVISSFQINAQNTNQPKLVIGIVVDQMRWDYLYRYQEKYTANGLNRLLDKGYVCQNTQIPYVPTYTAPGHTCIYTGSVPAITGIVANNWYDKKIDKVIYCTDDNSVKTVGDSTLAGVMSPKNLLVTTITDELRLASNFQSKTIGIAIKDRGAILPAGHAANGAYWFSGASGNWITSTYYRNDLPTWVQNENKKVEQDKMMQQSWQTIMAIEKYHESTEDKVSWETPYKGEAEPVFTHQLEAELMKSPDLLRALPYGNTMTLEMAKAAITGEGLGADNITDFLTVSLSSTDYIGHQFGTNSVEIEDTYLRLDKDLANFFEYLDATVGKGKYVLFITADHGAAHNASFLQTHHIPSGNEISDSISKKINEFVAQKFGDKELIAGIINQQIYFDEKLLNDDIAKTNLLSQSLIQYIKTLPGVADVIELKNISTSTLVSDYKTDLTNGYNAQRSGNLYIVLQPGWMDDFTKGTTHGSFYRYDTHIPLIWYGAGVKQGVDYSQIYMTDISATIASMLHIQEPNGCIGKPIIGLFAK
jgi:predicted AlkP superfamily pyrophosphatase or phosphodiesterase